MGRIKFLALTITLALCMASFGQSDQEANQLRSQAFHYYNTQQYQKAAPYFLDIFESNNISVYFDYYINCLIRSDDYNTAEKAIERQIKADKSQPDHYVTLGYIYKVNGQKQRSEEYYEKALDESRKDLSKIHQLANGFLKYREYDYAEETYLRAADNLRQENLFRVDIANIYLMQRRYEKAVEMFLIELIEKPESYTRIKSRLRIGLSGDIDNSFLPALKKEIFKSLQSYPGNTTLEDILIWAYIQASEFNKALRQGIALDKRTNTYKKNILEIGTTALKVQAYAPAIEAFTYILDNPDTTKQNQGVMKHINYMAYNNLLDSRFQKLSNSGKQDPSDLKLFISQSKHFIHQYGINTNTYKSLMNLSWSIAYYQSDYDQAIAYIDSLILQPRIRSNIRAEAMLQKGDFILAMGNNWDAVLEYAKIEQLNSNNPMGSEAKFRKARTAYFSKDFEWAKSQLDILKGSTSKLIANNAFELAFIIRDNMDEDSISEALGLYAEADYLLFQKKHHEAFILCDSILEKFIDHQIIDDCMFLKAKIYESLNEKDSAFASYQTIWEKYPDDLFGHKALYKLAVFEEEYFQHPDKAMEYYKELMLRFPHSFYLVDSRERYRALNASSDFSDEKHE